MQTDITQQPGSFNPAPLTKKSSISVILSGCLAVIIAAFFTFRLSSTNPRQIDIPVLGSAGSYSFIDSQGNEVNQGSFNGNYLINFFFTSCPKICPLQMSKISALLKKYPDLQAMSVSVDPENDTVQRLNDYLGKYPQATPQQWKLVRNDIDKVKALADQLFLGFGEEASLHTTRFAVIDKEGRVRGLVESRDEDYLRKIEEILGNI